LDADLITGVRPLSEIKPSEIEQVRKEAFGSAERVFALYTFDVSEAFDWFIQAVKDPSLVEQFAKVFEQYRKAELHGSQVAEMFGKSLGENECAKNANSTSSFNSVQEGTKEGGVTFDV
jgi:hypothetical protein